MTHNEYEERKRRIEEQHRAGVELLEAGRRMQLRTLELLWMSGSEEAISLPAGPAPVAAPAPAAASPKQPRRPAYQVEADVAAALSSVPEEFTRDDILKVLDYEPDRSTLHRVLRRMVDEDRSLVLVERGTGRLPSLYRKAAG